MIVSAVCLLVNACHKRVFPVFKIENMLFCIPNEIEKQSGEMDSENKSMYQGLQYRYLGVIQ